MTPVTIYQIAREWADKILAGRVPFSTDLGASPELIEDYVVRYAALIETQAGYAAAAWARRRGEDPDKVPASTQAAIAERIAGDVARATMSHALADQAIADRLTIPSEKS